MRNGTIGGSGEAKTIGKERVRNVSLKDKKYNCKEALGIIGTWPWGKRGQGTLRNVRVHFFG